MAKKQKPRDLTPRQARFVAAYLGNGCNGKQAAISAGYSVKAAAAQAHELLHNAPAVVAAVAAARDALLAKGLFNAEVAMQRLESAAAFAQQTENATALARIIELQMKLHGLLVDKVDMRVQAPDIQGVLAEARQRAQVPLVTEYRRTDDAAPGEGCAHIEPEPITV